MNSVLNPEAPEFHPHLNTIQDGYICVNKTIKSSNSFPAGSSYDLFKTFTDFNIVTCKLSENVVIQSNQIVVAEVPAVKLKRNDNESNTQKIIDVNDFILDRIHINIDTVTGANKPNEGFMNGCKTTIAPWNHTPVIAKIKVGSTTLIGAKNVLRPQLNFKDHIDNSDSLWVPKISDKPNNIKPLALNIIYNDEGEAVGYEHPYRMELELYHPAAEFVAPDPAPAPFPPPLQDTPLTYVDTEDKLDELVKHLCDVTEIAVDVEHHSYRTYQGITCLIQITTCQGGDFIIDALAIREHIHKLNLSFTDPKKIKILHGAESDVVWLQRDFGVYIVGLFDTHQAAKVLNLNGLSLKYLLMKYCQVDADKKYQLADWRMRPLPDDLIEYARLDTHYLIYIWRQMKQELLDTEQGLGNLLDVFDLSRQICGTTYNKEVIHDGSHLPLYVKSKRSFNAQQMAALRILYKWRDAQARELDESTTYLIPNHMLLTLAETLPREVQGVNACCSPMPPFVRQNVITIHRMILSCRELPLEPQLFQMPTSVRSMLNVARPHNVLNYNVHDLGHYQDPTVDPADPEQAYSFTPDYSFITDPRNFQPDIHSFYTDCCEVVSDLNAEAKLFVPPYDRYRKYRSLAQTVEIKQYKQKEAKITAISQGNQIIKEEVIMKLQKAQEELEKAVAAEEMHKAGSAAKAEVKQEVRQEPLDEESADQEQQSADDYNKIAFQRKRKIVEKVEPKESIEDTSENKKKDNKQKVFNKACSNKNTLYKNINYKKFYSETANEPRLLKMKFKKS